MTCCGAEPLLEVRAGPLWMSVEMAPQWLEIRWRLEFLGKKQDVLSQVAKGCDESSRGLI